MSFIMVIYSLGDYPAIIRLCGTEGGVDWFMWGEASQSWCRVNPTLMPKGVKAHLNVCTVNEYYGLITIIFE